jgi:hypothetical protein
VSMLARGDDKGRRQKKARRSAVKLFVLWMIIVHVFVLRKLLLVLGLIKKVRTTLTKDNQSWEGRYPTCLPQVIAACTTRGVPGVSLTT